MLLSSAGNGNSGGPVAFEAGPTEFVAARRDMYPLGYFPTFGNSKVDHFLKQLGVHVCLE